MSRPSARVYDTLRLAILDGEHAAGTWLREESIAGALQVSRTPVRDALRRLEAEGLVELIPNRGAQVTGLASAELDDVFSLRAVLEGYAARRTAELCDQDVVAELARLCDEMDAAQTAEDADDRITELNMEFHRAIHQAAGNALLPRMLSGVIEISLVRHTFHHYTPEDTRRSLRQHRELVDAIVARDGMWAQAIMATHVMTARASLKRRAAAESGPGSATGPGAGPDPESESGSGAGSGSVSGPRG